jgi:hypothetical protein
VLRKQPREREHKSANRYMSLHFSKAQEAHLRRGSLMNSAETNAKHKSAAPASLDFPQCQRMNSASERIVVRRWVSIAMLTLLGFLCLTFSLGSGAPLVATAKTQEKSRDHEEYPYHDGPPEAPLPPVLDPKQFDKTIVQNAYRLADKLKGVLYQQPCYCHCGRYLHHTSLLDCFASKHTAGCGICLQELFHIYEQTSKGQTPMQIRQGIMRGEWKALETKKYEDPLPNQEPAFH